MRSPTDVLLGSFFLVMLSVTIGFWGHAATGAPLPLFVEHTPALPDGVDTVEVDRARQLWEQGWLFVDAREAVAFEAGRIQDALSLPFAQEVEPSLRERLAKAPGLVVYCDGPDCGASRKVAARLVGLGLPSVVVMPEGYPAWKARGFPQH